jgi:hypothetical protein
MRFGRACGGARDSSSMERYVLGRPPDGTERMTSPMWRRQERLSPRQPSGARSPAPANREHHRRDPGRDPGVGARRAVRGGRRCAARARHRRRAAQRVASLARRAPRAPSSRARVCAHRSSPRCGLRDRVGAPILRPVARIIARHRGARCSGCRAVVRRRCAQHG